FALITLLVVVQAHAKPPYQDLFDLSLRQLNSVNIDDVVTQAAKWEAKSLDLPFSVLFLRPYDYSTPFLNSIRDIDQRISGLVVTEFNEVTPQFYIRGIGSNSSGAGDDPSVAFLIDGVNVARPGFHKLPLFDLHQVEIIKGAQGSLYGKGVIGGAVNHIPNKPEFNTFSHMRATAMGRGWQVQGINNTVLSDTFANRVSFSATDTQGYVANHQTGRDTGAYNYLAFREQFLWQAQEQSVNFLLGYFDTESLDPAQSYHGDAPPQGVFLAPYRNQAFDVAAYVDGESHRQFGFASLKYVSGVDDGRWISITSYNKGRYDFTLNVVPVASQSVLNLADEAASQVSQEIRFEQIFNNIQWNTGLYVSREWVDRDEWADLRGLAVLYDVADTLSVDTPGVTLYQAVHDVKNWAFFFHGEWQFMDSWKANLGWRSDYVKKEFDLAVSGGDPFDISLDSSRDFSVSTDLSWHKNSFSLSLAKYFSDDLVVYGRVASGFKAGNFNSVSSSPESALAASNPEMAVNNELGLKAFFFRHKLQINTAAFYTDYKDLQVFTNEDTEANAPKATITGVDWDVRARLWPGVELTANYPYLDTTFDEFVSPSGVNLRGYHLPRAPRQAVALAFSYSWISDQGNNFWAEFQASHTDEFFITPKTLRGAGFLQQR
ncbi:MAG: TonB-dependent receptor, partial [Pseudomonadales bacterium]|nr:TonB-dependent receptor [Pseudomonadales bacterium]